VEVRPSGLQADVLLFTLFSGRLEDAVNGRLGSERRAVLEAEDVLQETALRALHSVECFGCRGEESFLRWLAGIAEYRGAA
jgi:DNA-directed RNA polymerase specialized sigma24 family protein